MTLLFLLVFVSFPFTIADDRPRVWNRIPKYFVDQRVQNFINQHQITNCFGFVEDENYLRLKCWKNNKLTDVDIKIKSGKTKKKHLLMIFSL